MAVPALGQSALELTKGPDFQTVNEGDTATFSIGVQNRGLVELTNVTVTDPATPDCERNLGTLQPSQRVSYTCTTGPLAESFSNLATVAADQDPGNEAAAFVEVIPKEIEILKTPDVQTVAPGEVATFNIEIRNLGQRSLTNLVVSDPEAPDCSRGPMDLPSLGPQESTEYTCSSAPLFADLTNVAEVTAEAVVVPMATGGNGNVGARGVLPDIVTDTDDAFVDVIEPIEISKEPSEQFLAPGDSAGFTITVTNPSATDTLTDVTVADPATPDCDRNLGTLGPGEASTPYACSTGPLFSNLTNVATVTAQGPEGAVTANAAAIVTLAETRIEIAKNPPLQMVAFGAAASFEITVTNPDPTAKESVVVSDPATPSCDRNLGTLAPGASATYSCSTAPLLADLENVATVTALSVTGPVLAQDTAFADVDEPMAISKAPGLQTVDPGAAAMFTITVENLGVSTLTGVTVSDPATPDCDRSLGNLAPGAVVSYDCTTGPLASDFENIATVTAGTPAGAVSLSASAFVNVANPLEIRKQALTPTVPIGSPALFRIILANTTSGPITNISVSDPLTPDCDRAAGVLADLPGATNLSYTCETAPLDADLTNVATATGTAAGEPVEASDSARVEVFDPKLWSGPTATGTGTATLVFTGGGADCGFAEAEGIPLTGHPASPPAGSAPQGILFPHGLFRFRIENCTPGFTADFLLVLPQPLPPGTRLFKFGPTLEIPAGHWYKLPAVVDGATLAFSITDGGLGDNDLSADGNLHDPLGPGAPVTITAIPTLGTWGVLLLAGLLASGGLLYLRRAG